MAASETETPKSPGIMNSVPRGIGFVAGKTVSMVLHPIHSTTRLLARKKHQKACPETETTRQVKAQQRLEIMEERVRRMTQGAVARLQEGEIHMDSDVTSESPTPAIDAVRAKIEATRVKPTASEPKEH